MRKVLHVGCGGEKLPPQVFDGFTEVRLDIDEGCNPDIVASMVDLGEIGSFAAVYSCHSLEHLHPHDVAKALLEFKRVLEDGGYALIIVPDLENVRPTHEVVYQSEAGPITGHDMYYGCARMSIDKPYMRHQCGFVAQTLKDALQAAGFSRCETKTVNGWNLMGLAVK